MVKHIVVYTLKEGVDKDEAVKLIASKLEPLVGQIPGLLKMEIRRCYRGWIMPCILSSRRRRMYRLTGLILCIRRLSPTSTICWIPVFLRITKFKPK